MVSLDSQAMATGLPVGDVMFTISDAWDPVPVNGSMRKAQFRVSGHGSHGDGVVIFYHFAPGRGGSTEANIERWRRQFVDPAERSAAKVEQFSFPHHNIVYFQGIGDVHNGPGNILERYGFLGGIVENLNGSIFIRFSGPRELVEKSVNSFQKMLISAAPQK